MAFKRYEDEDEAKKKKTPPSDDEDYDDEDDEDEDDEDSDEEEEDETPKSKKMKKSVEDPEVRVLDYDEMCSAISDQVAAQIAPVAKAVSDLQKALTESDSQGTKKALKKALAPIISHLDDCFEAIAESQVSLKKALDAQATENAELKKSITSQSEAQDLLAKTTPEVKTRKILDETILQKSVTKTAEKVEGADISNVRSRAVALQSGGKRIAELDAFDNHPSVETLAALKKAIE